MAGQLIKRGDRKYLIRIYMGRDSDGKRIYYNETVRGTRREADQVKRRLLLAKDQGGVVAPSRRPVGEYLLEWVREMKPSLAEKTRESYEWIILNYVIPDLGSVRMDQLRPLHVQRLCNDLTGRDLSARTVRYTHSVLKTALNDAVKNGAIPRNPTSHTDLPKTTKRVARALTAEEAREFLGAIEGDRHQMLWEILLVAGLRPGEALGLKWSDLDLDSGRLEVRRTVRRRSADDWEFKSPKTARSRRSVVIPGDTVDALRRHRSGQSQRRLKAGPDWVDTDLVFADRIGRPIDYRRAVRRHFKPIVKSAGLDPLRPYDLRHTCATLLLAAREHPKVVAERLGHSSTAMTMDVYSHVLPDMQREASNSLGAIVYGS